MIRCTATKDGLQCVLPAGHAEPHQAPIADPGWVVPPSPIAPSAPPTAAAIVPPAAKRQRSVAERVMWILILLAVAGGAAVIYPQLNGGATLSGTGGAMNPNAVGSAISYDELFRNADAHRGQEVTLYARINQVIPDGSGFQFLVEVEPDQYGLALNHDVFLYGYTGPRLLQDDVVDIVGQAQGIQTYKTILNATREVPSVRVDRITISPRAWPTF